MNRQKWTILVLALAIIGGGAVALNRLRTNQKLGLPGVKTTSIAGSRRVNIYLPEQVLDYDSTNVPIELGSLPPDTSIGQRRYVSRTNPDDFLSLNVVLMGTDRTSIHKPQFCLTGQGWQLDGAEYHETIPISRPHPYDLPLTRLLTSGVMTTKSGEQENLRGVYVYWFVADDEIAGRSEQLMWKTATHLLHTGELRRWAYIACLAVCRPGEEDATYERIQKFLAASVPEFQLASGARNTAQNDPARTASNHP